MEKARVLIVGGGLVGASLAIALAKAGISVIAVDRDPPAEAVLPPYDGRASAIAAAGWRMLHRLGIAENIQDSQPIEQIRVSDGNSPLFLHYDHQDLGDTPLGVMVENRHTRLALAKTMTGLDNLHLIAPASVDRIERLDSHVLAHLSTGETVRAELCVAADGRQSRTRADAGIDTVGWSYGQDGIVCTIGHERPHQGIAHERFLPSGPFAILPLSGNRASLVWTERSDLAPAFLELNEADFTAEIQRRVGGFLGEIEVLGGRFRYPLNMVLATRYQDRRLALVGDAAHGIHPIAGQGFNLGLRDVAALTECLSQAASLGLDLGDPGALTDYERWRRPDSVLLSSTMDVLNRLFSNDIAPVAMARDLGLAAVNKLKPARKFFMRHAMGDVGNLPPLLR